MLLWKNDPVPPWNETPPGGRFAQWKSPKSAPAMIFYVWLFGGGALKKRGVLIKAISSFRQIRF
jgi:hypothetical protein